MQGLGVLCPLDSFTIEHGSKHNGRVAMKGIRKIGGLARGCEPEGTADELCKRKEADAAKPEPPGEIIAEALKFLRADRTGRWHVRAPEGPWHRDGLYGWKISDREVERLLRLLWPNYVASRQRLADRLYGGEVSRVSTSWRHALEAALDREARARRDFARRREKWKQERRQSEELGHRRMPAEQRRELERKEHDVRMKTIYAELDERDKGSAVRALMAVRSHARHGRINQLQDLLVGIAEMGSVGATPENIKSMIVRRSAHLLAPEEREKRGREIAEALVTNNVLVAANPDRFALRATDD